MMVSVPNPWVPRTREKELTHVRLAMEIITREARGVKEETTLNGIREISSHPK